MRLQGSAVGGLARPACGGGARRRAQPQPPRAEGVGPREVLTPRQRTKMDPSDDRDFYSMPRIGVHHVDSAFRKGVAELYCELIPDGADVLDLCSSWVSHFPPERKYRRVVGHGLNADELGRNPQLDSFFVRNLNSEPDGWALGDAAFDAVTCCVSVQYLQQPERVFAEVRRVLRPGGVCVVTFSNRMFGTKAIQAWTGNTDFGRLTLVKSYLLAAGFAEVEALTQAPAPGAGGAAPQGGLLAQLSRWVETALAMGSSDPFFAVIGYRDFRPPGQ